MLSKWEVFKPGEGPRPTVGNFAKIVYYDLDRPDVIADLQEKIGMFVGISERRAGSLCYVFVALNMN